MPWMELKPMDLKLIFIADYLRGIHSFTAICKNANISRKTGYKWVNRYLEHGIEGLQEHTRKPHNSPTKLPYSIREDILKIRTTSSFKLGPKKIQARLKVKYDESLVPCVTTIYNVLKEASLIEPAKAKSRVPICHHPKESPQHCNEQWSIDFKGQFSLSSGEQCYPLTVMDSHSRFLLGCEGLHSVGTVDTKRALISIFQEYGLPKYILSDNGVPFSTKTAGGLSRLSIWWIKLGICPIRIQPGKPQQNGKHERMHRTLKEVAIEPRANSMSTQQKRFDKFRYSYNFNRPHEALEQRTPASIFSNSLRPYSSATPEIEYKSYYQLHKVSSSGVVYVFGGQIYISQLLAGEIIAFEEIAEGCWNVYFGMIRLGYFSKSSLLSSPTNYWKLVR